MTSSEVQVRYHVPLELAPSDYPLMHYYWALITERVHFKYCATVGILEWSSRQSDGEAITSFYKLHF